MNKLDHTSIDWVRVNKLLEKGISKENMNRRIYRAKVNGYLEEYLALCLVKGMNNFSERNPL